MELLQKAKEKWGAFGEWISIVGPIFGLFIYVHHENVHLNHRLDTHILQINKRCDMLHERCDVLHQEFIDLIKEKRRE